MARFALRFPLFSPLVASMITGLNTEAQVQEAVDALDGIRPRPEIMDRAYRLWRSDFDESTLEVARTVNDYVAEAGGWLPATSACKRMRR